jgi:hypothetical protein
MLCSHPTYQSNGRAEPIGVLFDLQGQVPPVGRSTRDTDGNTSATRNQLTYWYLAFEVRPQFQHLLRIQHWCRMSAV